MRKTFELSGPDFMLYRTTWAQPIDTKGRTSFRTVFTKTPMSKQSNSFFLLIQKAQKSRIHQRGSRIVLLTQI